MIDLRQQQRGFVFKLRALCLEIFFRVLAGPVLEVQIAQVLIELFLALQQKVCLLYTSRLDEKRQHDLLAIALPNMTS